MRLVRIQVSCGLVLPIYEKHFENSISSAGDSAEIIAANQ
jgi:hypothetical protein